MSSREGVTTVDLPAVAIVALGGALVVLIVVLARRLLQAMASLVDKDDDSHA